MVDTQVPIPETLYDEAGRVARERELSFAEGVRRGLEIIVPMYLLLLEKEWKLPTPIAWSKKRRRLEDLRDISRADAETHPVENL